VFDEHRHMKPYTWTYRNNRWVTTKDSFYDINGVHCPGCKELIKTLSKCNYDPIRNGDYNDVYRVLRCDFCHIELDLLIDLNE
jgi:phage FluMu protein Com